MQGSGRGTQLLAAAPRQGVEAPRPTTPEASAETSVDIQTST